MFTCKKGFHGEISLEETELAEVKLQSFSGLQCTKFTPKVLSISQNHLIVGHFFLNGEYFAK